MAGDDYYSGENINARAADKLRETFDDLQNEMAGRDTGKISRFLSNEERERRSGKAAADKSFQTQLQMLLDNPAYAAAYNDVMKLLREAELRTQTAIDQTEQDLADNDAELDDIQSRASTLPDGTRVYRDADGNVFNEDGEQVHAPENDAIVWREDNPSYEAYIANRERDTALRDYLGRLRDYQTDVLGTARERMMNPDGPPSFADLDGIGKGIEGQRPELSASENTPSNDPKIVADSHMDLAKPQI